MDITTTGGGLRLNPPAAATWTLYTPVTGDAGLAKGGSGTLVTTTLTRATIRPVYDDGVFAQVTFGSGVTLDGRTLIDFGRMAEDPLPTDLKDVVVARWTGTKPDVTRWRGVNLGNDAYRMKFVVNDNGTITGTVAPKDGLQIILR